VLCRRMRKDFAVAAFAAAALIASVGFVVTAAGAHPAAATYKCRNQTYSYTKGAKNILNSTAGPRVRTSAPGSQALTDNRIVGGYETEMTGKFVDVTTQFLPGQKVSRLESVTLYPTVGKPKHFVIGTNPNHDEVYKYDLIKDRGQVMVPVNGDDGSGRATPKLKRVVVKARESCFATQ
jgi:hypothetical protein